MIGGYGLYGAIRLGIIWGILLMSFWEPKAFITGLFMFLEGAYSVIYVGILRSKYIYRMLIGSVLTLWLQLWGGLLLFKGEEG